ncbi:hypothetical protein Aduo_012261 [Ancylostoma duodenale]
MVFPKYKIEGCFFHLSQAWNKRSDYLGLKQYIHGDKREETDPPVSEGHGAHGKYVEFLDYLKTTRMEGLYQDLWRKWTISELRTSNVAEAFHRGFGTLIKVRHPSLATLLHQRRVPYLFTPAATK